MPGAETRKSADLDDELRDAKKRIYENSKISI